MRKITLLVIFVLLMALAGCSNNDSENRTIPIDGAKEAAVSAAGLTMEDVQVTKAELDSDEKNPYYEIEFVGNGHEYEYKIDAVSAKVVSESKEAVPEPKPMNPGPQAPPASNGGGEIDMENAKQIAFDHAGVNATDATITKSETDIDNGKQEFEIEFVSGDQEYEYTIDAATGEIKSSSQEKISN